MDLFSIHRRGTQITVGRTFPSAHAAMERAQVLADQYPVPVHIEVHRMTHEQPDPILVGVVTNEHAERV